VGAAARSKEFVQRAQELAGELMKHRQDWPDDQPDDREVWHPATEAEARLLLGEWAKAAQRYCFIAAQPAQPQSMRQQVHRLVAAWELLGVKERGPFQTAEIVFSA
jgi:hypothetical protein